MHWWHSPRERNWLTVVCVGLVFCSWPGASGMRLTCKSTNESRPTLYENYTRTNTQMISDNIKVRVSLTWRNASINGIDSMSPTVPPNSIIQISGCDKVCSAPRFTFTHISNSQRFYFFSNQNIKINHFKINEQQHKPKKRWKPSTINISKANSKIQILTGIDATRSIHFWISLTMCGTTCTVLPKYLPCLSLAITLHNTREQ